MAGKEEKKNTFILYLDSFDLICKLNMEQRGHLLTAIFEHERGEQVHALDQIVDIAFTPIMQYLDRNREAYKSKCIINAENGKKGGRPPKTERFQEKPNGYFENRTKPNKTLNESDNESENEHCHNKVERSGENAGLALPGETDEECKKRLEALRNQ